MTSEQFLTLSPYILVYRPRNRLNTAVSAVLENAHQLLMEANIAVGRPSDRLEKLLGWNFSGLWDNAVNLANSLK